MKENLVNLSFLAAGHVVQDIVLNTEEPITAEEMVRMLNVGEAFTSVHEDNDVIMADGRVIGTVRWSDTELEISDFQVEGGDYEQTAPDKKPFNMSRLALAGAIGEYVYEPEMSVTDIIKSLNESGTNNPELTLESLYQDSRACDIMKLIRLDEQGLKNLMTLAYNAGKDGQEII